MAVMELMMPPTMREQQTIGGFFQQLDHLITLHQRKCIFFTGRAGRLISTVNKKRITSSWEQRKFDEVFDCTVPNNTLSRAELSYDEGTVLNVHYGDVLIKYGSVLDVQRMIFLASRIDAERISMGLYCRMVMLLSLIPQKMKRPEKPVK